MKQIVQRYCHSRIKLLEAQNLHRDSGLHYKCTGALTGFISIGRIIIIYDVMHRSGDIKTGNKCVDKWWLTLPKTVS